MEKSDFDPFRLFKVKQVGYDKNSKPITRDAGVVAAVNKESAEKSEAAKLGTNQIGETMIRVKVEPYRPPKK